MEMKQLLWRSVYDSADRVTYCKIVFYIIFREPRSHFEKFTGIEDLCNEGVQIATQKFQTEKERMREWKQVVMQEVARELQRYGFQLARKSTPYHCHSGHPVY